MKQPEFFTASMEGLEIQIFRNDHIQDDQESYYHKTGRQLFVNGKLMYGIMAGTCDTLEEYTDTAIAYAKSYLKNKIYA